MKIAPVFRRNELAVRIYKERRSIFRNVFAKLRQSY